MNTTSGIRVAGGSGKHLTVMQLRVLRAFADFRLRHGFNPTYDEVAEQLDGRNKVTVYGHVLALVAKGYMVHEAGRTRSAQLAPGVVVPGEGTNPVRFRLLGVVGPDGFVRYRDGRGRA